jgi:hypothetical protein
MVGEHPDGLELLIAQQVSLVDFTDRRESQMASDLR